jgi:hypothetical protein
MHDSLGHYSGTSRLIFIENSFQEWTPAFSQLTKNPMTRRMG